MTFGKSLGARISVIMNPTLQGKLLRLRRPFFSALALMLVAASVVLTLDALLPFPPPGQLVLYDSSDWSLLLGRTGRGGDPP